MATLDGYDPYPLGLTASEVVQALNRAFNLDDGDFVKYTADTAQPANPKTGDVWINTTTYKVYRAYVYNFDIVWLEV
jgi:hypothetical protein